MTHRLPRLIAPLAALALALTACTAGAGTAPAPTATGGSTAAGGPSTDKITLGLVAEPASLDFTKTDGAAIPQALLVNVYEGLVKLDQDGKIVPALAASWKVSDDHKTYTFELTDKAKFSNGAAFTADDAVFSINRVKTDWTTSLKAAMDVVTEAKAISPTQLQVTLSAPSNDWLYRMTTHIGAMFSKTGVEDLANKPVGTGPYTFTSWNRGDSITLTRNDGYWGTKPYYQAVVLKYFKDATALNNALLTGTINVVTTVQAPEALGQFTSNAKYQVIEGTTNGEVLLSFNNAQEIFKDKKVRQAVRYGIDHKALMDTCWAGKGTLIGSFVPPTDPWYEDLTGVTPFDKAKATALLAEAGKTGTTLRLRVPTLPYATSCGQVVKAQLEAVGFKVTLDSLEFPAAWLTTVFKGGDFDMSIVAHVEPRDLKGVFGNPEYYTHYGTADIQALLKAADEGSADDQVTNLKKAARLIAEDAAGDVLFLLPNLMVADKGITGLPKNGIAVAFDLSKLAKG
ncbi:MAG: ABC transporter substrate-binding protein [Actinomycetales bacterium]|uniref:ABC transporter substrate-binding protein n=1 Tax=Candidatus Phosphoribacter hodrii TaxID=2953743 RepID=A0A935IKU1_9MICO|nr:ABC transporter substrate-binding protein [Candidatus Phosphoribacter hodrii]MBK7273170.1 ABC transporter substrate-binding protein [Candidatus Phosphoribacter hodrii]